MKLCTAFTVPAVFQIELWRSDYLTGVIEMDRTGTVVSAGMKV